MTDKEYWQIRHRIYYREVTAKRLDERNARRRELYAIKKGSPVRPYKRKCKEAE